MLAHHNVAVSVIQWTTTIRGRKNQRRCLDCGEIWKRKIETGDASSLGWMSVSSLTIKSWGVLRRGEGNQHARLCTTKTTTRT